MIQDVFAVAYVFGAGFFGWLTARNVEATFKGWLCAIVVAVTWPVYLATIVLDWCYGELHRDANGRV